ncbi:DNA methyltransferase [Aporhodopirellula aestuarii]|uniref:Site-specific DNA-methyltransferase n=1 Tax=Aporhodopirellula aestuarii TaxID=2950107 RepID=A0ABT0U306_9BACT|nr:DNA methyltransferase [Aporhodopirellula aestuarii]MCM2371235.1 site-specific DNA-methyltransferase [Aporhodopirellula aestuarii]
MISIDLLNQIHAGDCVAGMAELPAGTVDLVFADPPFNIGYQYDVYEDSLESDDYLRWSENWIRGVHRVLKSDGAFWLAIGDEYAAELKVLSQRIGFTCRSWVIWYYTFGVHCKYKFTRSHAHLFHFVKDPNKFTFNADDPNLRVPSARQLVYNDKRANSKGRMPDDTWILRPQDLPSGFSADEDVWYFPRVAGTFKERAGFHGCQMPEHLLGRIIRSSSNGDEIVLDPFSGSGTTAAVAKKLGRQYITFDMSEEYAQLGNERLQQITVGDPLVGSADPLRSVPSTAAGKRDKKIPDKQRAAEKRKATQSLGLQMSLEFGSSPDDENDEIVIEAFRQSHAGFSVDRVLLDSVMNERFITACREGGSTASELELRKQLAQLRFVGTLSAENLQPSEPTIVPDETLERYRFASEIAWRLTADRYPKWTLDDLLIDPEIVRQFDTIASQVAPACDPFTLRWGTLKLRSLAPAVIAQANKRGGRAGQGGKKNATDLFKKTTAVTPEKIHWPNSNEPFGGVYKIESGQGTVLYVGESTNLPMRMRDHFDHASSLDFWSTLAGGTPRVRLAFVEPNESDSVQIRLQPWYRELLGHDDVACNCVDLWLPSETED